MSPDCWPKPIYRPGRDNSLSKSLLRPKALLRLLDDLLDLTKVEAGKLVIDRHDFDFHDVMRQVTDIMGQRAEAKGLELRADISHDTPQWVHGDSTRMRQILLNLVSNAIKFTDRGTVELCVTFIPEGSDPPKSSGRNPNRFKKDGAAAAKIHCAVRDTGIGIAEEVRAQIFRPYRQAQTSTSRQYGGTGLGLAISKQIVELLGGSIGVRSTLGEGSVFFLRDPLRARFRTRV